MSKHANLDSSLHLNNKKTRELSQLKIKKKTNRNTFRSNGGFDIDQSNGIVRDDLGLNLTEE